MTVSQAIHTPCPHCGDVGDIVTHTGFAARHDEYILLECPECGHRWEGYDNSACQCEDHQRDSH